MKRQLGLILVVVVTMMMVSACTHTRTLTISRVQKNIGATRQPVAGMVPVHIENPDLEKQQICFFEGSTSVRLIPDAQNGGWKYSRPAIGCIQVGGANSRNNWYEYVSVGMPRNFNFVWAARHGIIDWQSLLSNRLPSPWGPPYFGYGRTGSDPYSVRYRKNTPSGGDVYVGGLIRLQQEPSSVRPLIVNIDIDTRPYSAAIAEGLTEAAYGRRR